MLLLGARQVGKTTLIEHLYPTALHYHFADPRERLRIARDPSLLIDEVRARLPRGGKFLIDEVQKIPLIFDALQVLLDQRSPRYTAILTGSSARQLKRGAVNTLPGRVLQLQLGPLSAHELGYYAERSPTQRARQLLHMLTFGTLPGIQSLPATRASRHLQSYVQTYLEQEILGDALTKDVGQFARFLSVMAARAGQILHYTNLSQSAGASVNTIKHHVGVLVDTMTATLIPGFSLSDTAAWLSTPRLLLFDLGVRNAAAERVLQPAALAAEYGPLFEQWVGLELLHWMRNRVPQPRLYYWRTTQHREVDWVIACGKKILALEIKWADQWRAGDLNHLSALRSELKARGYRVTTGLVCRTPHEAVHDHHHILPPHQLWDCLQTWGEKN